MPFNMTCNQLKVHVIKRFIITFRNLRKQYCLAVFYPDIIHNQFAINNFINPVISYFLTYFLSFFLSFLLTYLFPYPLPTTYYLLLLLTTYLLPLPSLLIPHS